MAKSEGIKQRSCGAAEIGVILSSDLDRQQQAGKILEMDDITAEVSEREEYSNDFSEESKNDNSPIS